MKAIALWAPWSTLIGIKEIETRHWDTQVRGRIAICAAKRWSKEMNATCNRSPFREGLISLGHMPDNRGRWDLPRGVIVATAVLEACYCISANPHTYTTPSGRSVLIPPNEPERSFGGYDPGRYALALHDIKLLTRRVEVSSGQKWFEVDDDLIWEEDLITPAEAISRAVGHASLA